MCMILDANQYDHFINKKSKDVELIHDWLDNKNGALVYSDHKQMEKEIKKSPRFQKFLFEKSRTGKSKKVDKKEVEKSMKIIKKNHQLKSDDLVTLGLAHASGVKLLCSKDKNLHDDFKTIIRGGVYQNKDHKRLLKKDICP